MNVQELSNDNLNFKIARILNHKVYPKHDWWPDDDCDYFKCYSCGKIVSWRDKDEDLTPCSPRYCEDSSLMDQAVLNIAQNRRALYTSWLCLGEKDRFWSQLNATPRQKAEAFYLAMTGEV